MGGEAPATPPLRCALEARGRAHVLERRQEAQLGRQRAMQLIVVEVPARGARRRGASSSTGRGSRRARAPGSKPALVQVREPCEPSEEGWNGPGEAVVAAQFPVGHRVRQGREARQSAAGRAARRTRPPRASSARHAQVGKRVKVAELGGYGARQPSEAVFEAVVLLAAHGGRGRVGRAAARGEEGRATSSRAEGRAGACGSAAWHAEVFRPAALTRARGQRGVRGVAHRAIPTPGRLSRRRAHVIAC